MSIKGFIVNGTIQKYDFNALDNIPEIPSVDSSLSSSSTNPVQNKVIKEAIDAKYTKPENGIPAEDLASGVISVLSVDGKTGSVAILPPGGSPGQVLQKASSSDYDVEWVTGSGGSVTVDSSFSSTSTNPLQNKVVNAAIFNGTSILAGTDLNDLIATGRYYTVSTTYPTDSTESLVHCPVPRGTHFSLDVEVYDNSTPSGSTSNRVVQKIYKTNNNYGNTLEFETFVRIRFGGYGWSEWSKMSTSDDIDNVYNDATTYIDTKVKYDVYNSVTDLSLTSGSAAISSAWDSMPNSSMLICSASEFTSSEVPVTYGIVEIIKTSSSRGCVNFYGKTSSNSDYRMYLSSSTDKPDGTWNRLVGIPSGGATGQVLQKNSGSDYDIGWVTGGGATITVDSSLSSSSTNPVQNKVIYSTFFKGAQIPASADLDDYVHTGRYYTVSGTYTSGTSLSNSPVATGVHFMLDVEGYASSDDGSRVVQNLYVGSYLKKYTRTKFGTYGWTDWETSVVADEVSPIGFKRIYFVDGIRGDDSNDGLSYAKPLRSLDRVFELCNQNDLRINFINKSGAATEMVYNTSAQYFSNMSIHFINWTSPWPDKTNYYDNVEDDHNTSVRINFTCDSDVQFYNCYTHIDGIKFSNYTSANPSIRTGHKIYFDGGFINHSGKTKGKTNPVLYPVVFDIGTALCYNGATICADNIICYSMYHKYSRGLISNLTLTATDPDINVFATSHSYITLAGTFNYSTAASSNNKKLLNVEYGEFRFFASVGSTATNREYALVTEGCFVYIPTPNYSALEALGTIAVKPNSYGFINKL